MADDNFIEPILEKIGHIVNQKKYI
jgi:hypothetical protein